MKLLFIFLALLPFYTLVLAVSALPGIKIFKQNNGTKFQGTLKGDEWLNYISLPNNYVAIFNKKSKNYEYALIEVIDGKSKLVSSGQAVDESLHLDMPHELSKTVPVLDALSLSKLDRTSDRDTFGRHAHTLDHNKSNYKNKILKTKSRQWKEILKEKDLPK